MNLYSLSAHAQAICTVVCLFVSVCLSVCRSTATAAQGLLRVSIGFYSHVFLDSSSWICEVTRVMLTFAYLNGIAAFSEECIAKLVHRVLLLYLVVSSALECWLLVAARVRRELQGSADAAIQF